METKLTCILLFFIVSSKAQFNEQKGAVAEGYDVISYFEETPEKGSSDFVTIYEDAEFRFVSEKHLRTFQENPKKYLPQYGGYCAYAIANGEKVKINPKTYEIRDGKLYLFYNSWGNNTLGLWQKEGAVELQKQADTNWKRMGH
ncbi:hypothetical protein HX109_04370 [Galbibacter sp. BG1]|uniref:YHS domain-containing (seleno)protein n=1 Tax=Galbibacter sp. BG1 TaxID=1170699 RepID=UPI0015BCDEE1|nr:YHS domain-containing (seleno)protein [Galbibacter sp. BG1]QLE00837.1 hypothetical protein HX109_04370 [Galbibacter sp. BG1]